MTNYSLNRCKNSNNLITPNLEQNEVLNQPNFPQNSFSLPVSQPAISCKLPLSGRKNIEVSINQETVTQVGKGVQYCVEHRKEIIQLATGVAIAIGTGVAVSHIGKNNSKKKGK